MFFFFKQKTAYEMRISDWSSDVCSSDLLAARRDAAFVRREREHLAVARDHLAVGVDHRGGVVDRVAVAFVQRTGDQPDAAVAGGAAQDLLGVAGQALRVGGVHAEAAQLARSEEHTSELQSLMRISYAVFCLKKKKSNT